MAISEEELCAIWKFVNTLCCAKYSSKAFPGGLPVSLSRSHLGRIHGVHPGKLLEYTLSYKADGERVYLGFLCIQGRSVSFTLDRTGKVRAIDLPVGDNRYEGTLFDVEVIDKSLLLIFDCASINGNSCCNEFYPNRLELAREFLASCVGAVGYTTTATHRADSRMYASGYPDRTVEPPAKNWKLKVKSLFYPARVGDLHQEWYYPVDGFIWTLATAPFFTRNHGPLELVVLKW